MTPQEFCDLINPHLPIGPYTRVSAYNSIYDFPNTVEVWTGDITAASVSSPNHAANLLLGAVVVEGVSTVHTGGFHGRFSSYGLVFPRSADTTDPDPVGTLVMAITERSERGKYARAQKAAQ